MAQQARTALCQDQVLELEVTKIFETDLNREGKRDAPVAAAGGEPGTQTVAAGCAASAAGRRGSAASTAGDASYPWYLFIWPGEAKVHHEGDHLDAPSWRIAVQPPKLPKEKQPPVGGGPCVAEREGARLVRRRRLQRPILVLV